MAEAKKTVPVTTETRGQAPAASRGRSSVGSLRAEIVLSVRLPKTTEAQNKARQIEVKAQ